MALTAELRFDTALGDRARDMVGAALQAQSYLVKATVNIARKAEKRAAALTPRSTGGGPHMADGWTTEVKQDGVDVVATVLNKDPRATDKLKLADGSSTPYTLLDILEFGSKEHLIFPVNGPFLVFFWPKVGRMVRSKGVVHPGTRPYSMMALARVDANVDAKRVYDALRTVLTLHLLGKGGRLNLPNPFGG